MDHPRSHFVTLGRQVRAFYADSTRNDDEDTNNEVEDLKEWGGSKFLG
jgi:hypothetical protein